VNFRWKSTFHDTILEYYTRQADSFHFWFDCNYPLLMMQAACSTSGSITRNTASAPRHCQAPLLATAKLRSSPLPSSAKLAPRLQDFSMLLTYVKLGIHLSARAWVLAPANLRLACARGYTHIKIICLTCDFDMTEGGGEAGSRWLWYHGWHHGLYQYIRVQDIM
jgi:hypothetical protein